MSTPEEGARPPELRVSDGDRDAVVAVLRTACTEGRITLDEFSERVEQVYTLRTAGELEAVTRDLPVPAPSTELVAQPRPAPPTTTTTPSRGRRWLVAVMGGTDTRGRWRADDQVNALAVCGGVNIDLRQAIIESPVIEIRAWAVMGGVDVVVPEGIPVEISGFVLMGGTSNRVRDVPALPGAPLVRVKARGLWGGVSVRSKRERPGRDRRTPRKQLPAPMPDTDLDDLVADLETDPPDLAPDAAADGTVTILFCDIEGSAALAERLGDRAWLDVVREHNRLVRDEVARFDGHEVKAQGDGFMITFTSARRAVLAAMAIQRTMSGYRAEHPDVPMQVRVGLHTGEVIHDRGDFFGRNVMLAARIAGVATGGEILVSSLVHDLAWGAELPFGPPREVELKGYDHAYRLHPVNWTP